MKKTFKPKILETVLAKCENFGTCNIIVFMIEQGVQNKSNLLLKNIFSRARKHYNYLQGILKEKEFRKVILNAKLVGLGRVT